MKDGIFVKTKDGIIKVVEIQGENAKRMSIQDYLRGNKIKQFDVLKKIKNNINNIWKYK